MIKTLFPVHLPKAIAACIIDYSRAEWSEARARAQGAIVCCCCATCGECKYLHTDSPVHPQRVLHWTFRSHWHRHNECNLCHGKRLVMTNPKMLWSFQYSLQALRWWVFHISPRNEEDLYAKYAAKMHGFLY